MIRTSPEVGQSPTAMDARVLDRVRPIEELALRHLTFSGS